MSWRFRSQYDAETSGKSQSSTAITLSPSCKHLSIGLISQSLQLASWLQCLFSELEELRIENLNITDTALKKAARHSPLRRLELRGCPNVTGGALKDYITSRCFLGPEDFRLLVSACPGVTGRDLAELSQFVDVVGQ
jgi:hypothetical protein